MDYFLKNEELIVRVSSFGAEIKSVLDAKNYTEHMWYGDKKYWGRTSPVLFPFVGSVKEKQYRVNGVSYEMCQHGFARDMEFTLVEQTDCMISFVLKSTEETMKKYPYAFELVITYTLTGNQVDVKWEVKNPADDTMHFSIGAHPAFLCPIHGEADKSGYQIYFDGVSQMEYIGINVETGLALKEQITALPLSDGKVCVTHDFFDKCAYIFEGNQTKLVAIEDPNGKRFAEVIFDTPLFAIWSPEGKNAPFVCIEPWYGRCDASDFDGDISERDYNNALAAGETFCGGYGMRFY